MFMTSPVDVQVGNNVRVKRTKLGLSQDNIANQLGLSLAEYQQYAFGVHRFGAERLLKLARLFSVGPQDFFESVPTSASAEFLN
jgi:transcriptional regulator with XRE-family HTH domain